MSTATKEPSIENAQPKEEGLKPEPSVALPVPSPNVPKASMLPPLSQVFNQISEGHVTAQNDIIAQTSMTIPSFTGIGQPPAAASPTPSIPVGNTPIPTAQTRLGTKSRLLRPLSDPGKVANAAPEDNKQENEAGGANRTNSPLTRPGGIYRTPGLFKSINRFRDRLWTAATLIIT